MASQMTLRRLIWLAWLVLPCLVMVTWSGIGRDDPADETDPIQTPEQQLSGQSKTHMAHSGAAHPTRLLVVDDHALIREGIRAMLTSEADLEVVGEAVNGQEALELGQELRPELVLMDVRMPVLDGIEATRAINEVSPETAVLMVTAYANPDYLFEAVKAGASGYVLKHSGKSGLTNAIRRVLVGGCPLAGEVAMRLLQSLAKEENQASVWPRLSPEPQNSPLSLPNPLTPRELEILQHLAQGHSNKEIAESLVLSVGTIKYHMRHILAKLGAADRSQAVLRAAKLGILKLW